LKRSVWKENKERPTKRERRGKREKVRKRGKARKRPICDLKSHLK